MEPSVVFDENHDQALTSRINSNIGFKNKFQGVFLREPAVALDTVVETSLTHEESPYNSKEQSA